MFLGALALLLGALVFTGDVARAEGPCDGPNKPAWCNRDRTPRPPRPTVVPATPVVINNLTTITCEGPYVNNLAYGQPYYGQAVFNFNSGHHPQYGGNFGWNQPMLVTRVNGVVTQAYPNVALCGPQVVQAPAPVATPVVVKEIVKEYVPVPVPVPVQAAPAPAPQRQVFIAPPRTGTGGLISE